MSVNDTTRGMERPSTRTVSFGGNSPETTQDIADQITRQQQTQCTSGSSTEGQ